MIIYVIRKIEGNNNSTDSLNVVVDYHYHGRNRVITQYFPYMPAGHRNINHLETTTHYHRLFLVTHHTWPLSAISVVCNNFVTVYWVFQGYIYCQSTSAVFLRATSLMIWFHHLSYQICFLPGSSNGISVDASRLWELNDNSLIQYFNNRFSQEKSWQISPLPIATSHYLNTVICARQLQT